MMIRPEPDTRYCSTWDVTDYTGEQITVAWCARTRMETAEDGTENLICRAMNWRGEREASSVPHIDLGARIINGLAQTGVHRVLVDLADWKLLKWLDEPAPFFNWRARESGLTVVHPDDAPHMARMTIEFGSGATSGVLRLRGNDGGWTPVHMTINRVELDDDTYAGLLALRIPTADEVATVDIDAAPTKSRKPRKAKGK
jgi:hypothetical protein